MERLAILLDGKRCGELLMEEQGLYVRYQAVCGLEENAGPVRLFAVGERGELRLGVLQPERGRFVLQRQLSAREAHQAGRLLRGELRPFTPEENGWQKLTEPEKLFRSRELRKRLREAETAMACRSGERSLVAFPFDPAKPFPMADMFCLASVRRIGQREYVVFCFDREERPILP